MLLTLDKKKKKKKLWKIIIIRDLVASTSYWTIPCTVSGPWLIQGNLRLQHPTLKKHTTNCHKDTTHRNWEEQ